MAKLTKDDIDTIRKIITIELQMIQFIKGFNKEKGQHELNLEKILEKLQ
jgi:hypothetical protein